MQEEPVLLDVDERGVATLTLDRPKVHNAFDDALIARLAGHVEALASDGAVRVVKLAARGKSFSAGADLSWMRRMAEYSEDQNLDDAMRLARMLRGLADLPKPTVAAVQGSAFGGGVGLVACCDVAVASERAQFSLSEVKLGLIPATIAPFVVEALGPRQARRLFLTAEPIDARKALELGLVHEVVAADALDDAVEAVIDRLLANGPQAMAAAKDLVAAVAHRAADETMLADTARRIAERRASVEGREGVRAFLEKRPPSWTER